MIAVYVLIGIVVAAACVVGFLFYLFNKETKKPAEQKVEPITVVQDKVEQAGPSQAEIEYKMRVEALEYELKEISDRGTSQASEAMALIDKLTQENQDLKMASVQSSDKNEDLIEAQKQTDQLRQDNFMLTSQLSQAQAKLGELEQEAMAIRQRMEEDLKHAGETIETLKAEKEAIINNRESSTQSVQSLTRELEETRAQALTLQSEVATLKETNDTLRVSNENMFNQTQMFQQELLRQRAQIAGLERICENYRIQVEEKV